MLPVGSYRFGLRKACLFSIVFQQLYIPSMGRVHFEQKCIQGCTRVFCFEALLCFPVTSRSHVHTLQAVTHRGWESSGGQNLTCRKDDLRSWTL